MWEYNCEESEAKYRETKEIDRNSAEQSELHKWVDCGIAVGPPNSHYSAEIRKQQKHMPDSVEAKRLNNC